MDVMKKPPYMLQGSPLQLDYFYPHESYCWAEVLKKLNKPNITAIDVGSCEGLWSINLADHFDEVHAFEPMPDVLEISKQWLPKNVITHNYALSNVETSYEMIYFDHNIGMTMKTGDEFIMNHMKNSPSKTFTAQTRTLDSFNFENVGFIKIDAEGEDENVLKGAEQTLERCKPLILIDSENRYDIPNYKWYAMIRNKNYSTVDEKHYVGAWLYEYNLV